jgi:hypothetical protein
LTNVASTARTNHEASQLILPASTRWEDDVPLSGTLANCGSVARRASFPVGKRRLSAHELVSVCACLPKHEIERAKQTGSDDHQAGKEQ